MPKTTGNNDKMAQCPYCGKTFYQGGFHPATQKLYHHTLGKHPKKANTVNWNTKNWQPVVVWAHKRWDSPRCVWWKRTRAAWIRDHTETKPVKLDTIPSQGLNSFHFLLCSYIPTPWYGKFHALRNKTIFFSFCCRLFHDWPCKVMTILRVWPPPHPPWSRCSFKYIPCHVPRASRPLRIFNVMMYWFLYDATVFSIQVCYSRLTGILRLGPIKLDLTWPGMSSSPSMVWWKVPSLVHWAGTVKSNMPVQQELWLEHWKKELQKLMQGSCLPSLFSATSISLQFVGEERVRHTLSLVKYHDCVLHRNSTSITCEHRGRHSRW